VAAAVAIMEHLHASAPALVEQPGAWPTGGNPMDEKQLSPTHGSKGCSRCGEDKPHGEFYPDRSKRTGLSSQCRPCSIEGARERYRKNRDRVRAYMRDYHRKHRDEARERQLVREYGITQADYDRMHEEQAGLCAICGAGEKLHVDHCHASGAVRGLLCSGCNRGIGFLGDDPERLSAAAAYLA
jgi:hypothetical protein